jgi:hypothetical protein
MFSNTTANYRTKLVYNYGEYETNTYTIRIQLKLTLYDSRFLKSEISWSQKNNYETDVMQQQFVVTQLYTILEETEET